MEFTISGFTFSFWQIFLFLIVAGAVVFLIDKWVN
nr:MAG TPA: FeoB-associated Cys-rich membrane protein [Inoviridae sp.]